MGILAKGAVGGRLKPVDTRRAALAGLCAVLASASPAAAQDRPPPLRLTSDVTIVYRHPIDAAAAAEAAGIDPASPAGQALRSVPEVQTRLFRQAATGRVRTENAGLVEIADLPARKAWRFDSVASNPADRVVTLTEGEDEVGMTVEEAAQDPDFVVQRQEGADQAAGIPCTNWRLRMQDEPESEAVLACFAADGLALRTAVTSAGTTSLQEAVRVDYAPLDAALFVPPPWPVRPGGRP